MQTLRTLVAAASLTLVSSAAIAETPETYRFPRECSMTDDGYPVPLCGKPITKTPVVAANPDATDLRSYPEHFIPEQEELAAKEMRLTAAGSGNPPVRRGQASTSWLVELGNGDKFIIDAGGGTVPALIFGIRWAGQGIRRCMSGADRAQHPNSAWLLLLRTSRKPVHGTREARRA
jgi:ribonuclease Z